MSKKTTKSTRTENKESQMAAMLKGKWTLWSLLILLILSIVGYIGYQKYADKVDRQRFIIAAQEIDGLRRKLQAVDANVVWEIKKDCVPGGGAVYASTIECFVSTVAEIPVKDLSYDEVKKIGEKYKKTVDGHEKFKLLKESSKPFPYDTGYRADEYTGGTNLPCSLSYSIENNNQKILKVSFGCSDEARDEYFGLYAN